MIEYSLEKRSSLALDKHTLRPYITARERIYNILWWAYPQGV